MHFTWISLACVLLATVAVEGKPGFIVHNRYHHFPAVNPYAGLLKRVKAIEAKLRAEEPTAGSCKVPVLGYAFNTKYATNDERESGAVASISYTKKYAFSLLRFTYSGNIRTLGAHTAGRWFILIDGHECQSPAKIDMGMYQDSGDNTHVPAVLRGICRTSTAGPIGVGTHNITVDVGNVIHHSASNKFTNWWTLATLEVEEICPAF